MIRLYIVVFLSLIYTSQAQDNSAKGIPFQEISLSEAFAKSAKENKLVFLHAYASWCHYCDYMRDSVYSKPEVADFFNKNFISIRMDMEKEGKEMNILSSMKKQRRDFL